MTTYVVTTGNWNDPLFWQAVSETTTGHALDFSGLGAAFDVQVDQSNGIVTVSDGVTTFTVGEAGVVGTDANFGGTTLLDFFTILSGSGGGDALDGTSGANMISGNSGDDTITYGEGADTVYGGDGNDLIDDAPGVNSTSSGNQIFADAGNDTVYGSAGNDTLYGGTGDDTLSGEGGADQIYGEDGLDTLNGGAGEDFINGGAGADLIYGGADADHLEGGWEDDASDTIWAGNGNDLIMSGGGGDTLYGEGGNDWIDGGAGSDSVEGGIGNDRVVGDLGNDTILGGDGYDVLTGGEGADSIDGGGDADQIWGNAGDTILGGETGDDNDTLYVSYVDSISYTTAESGTITFNSGDTLSFSGIEVVTELTPDGVVDGTAGADEMGQFYFDADGEWIDNGDAIGEGDGDSVRAGDGNDTIWSNDGNDTVHGEAGDDRIYLGNGDNVAFGGAGADTIEGEWQNDTISGDDFVATGPNLIVNGSFEDTTGMTVTGYGFAGTPNAPGWTDDNGIQIDFHNDVRGGLNATDGTNWADLEANPGQNNSISQTVAGVSDGQVYVLSFDAADLSNINDGTTLDNQLQVIWNGDVVGTIDASDGSWTSYEFHLIGGAGDATNTLTFAGLGDASGIGASLDNVQMYAAAEAVGGADSIDAWDGNDDIMAGAGDDTVLAGTGDDLVVAGSGNDSVVGDAGNDTVYGGDGNLLNADDPTGNDSMWLGTGDDLAYGEAGNDVIYGDDGFDILSGNEGADEIYGGDGIDKLQGGQGNDTLVGGNDTDYLTGDGQWYLLTDYASSGNVATNLTVTNSADGPIELWWIDQTGSAIFYQTIQAGDTYVQGTFEGHNWVLRDEDGFFLDLIAAGTNTTFDYGAKGLNDSLSGDAGNDEIYGQYGDDTISGGAGSDTIQGGTGNDSIQVGSGDDLAEGGTGNDTIEAGTGFDTLLGQDGNDSIVVGELDGTSTIDGGAGQDTLDVDTNANGFQITFNTDDGGVYNAVTGPASGIFSNIEVVWGSSADDTIDAGADTNGVQILAQSGDDSVVGGQGADLLSGQGGNDTISGGIGFDTIDGGEGNDSIDGGSGSDSITAGAGNDTVEGGFGNDTILGGDGNDSITDSGGVTSFDSIDGGTGNDTIDGGLGDDTLVGGQGDDTIDGGSQNDLLYGDHSDPGTSYYITSDGELYQYEPATGTSTLLHTGLEPYGDIATGPDGTLYGVVFSEAAASDAGIYRIDPDTGTETLVIDLPEGTEYHASLAADGAGNLYVNDDTTGTVTRYEPDGLGGFTSAGSVGTIVVDAKDIVFIDDSTAWVTANGDIYQYNVDGSGNFSNEVNLGTINVGQVDIFGLSLSEDGTVYAYEGSGEVWSTDPGVQPLVWSAEAATDLGTGVQLWGTANLAFTGGNDSIDGGDGDDTIFGGAGNDTLTAGNNTGAGDSLVGGDGDDVITDSFWNATLEGGDGADLFNVGYGTATVSGGEGGTDNDTLSFAVANDPANVTLNADEAGFYIDNDGDSGIFTGIEAFELTSGNDTLDAGGDTTGIEVFAGDGADSISGGSGNDSIDGDGGNDTLRGGQGSDTITGGDGINYLYGDDGNDSLIGNATDIGGFTEMEGGAGADTLDGTAGDWDIAQYYNSASAVDVDLTDGLTETGGDAQGDTLSGIEQIDGSNLGNDTIVGDAGVQEIKGWGGDDDLTLNSATGGTAYGGDGSDTITGTAGDDTLDGDDGLAAGGADSILAGAGNDQIIGDAGNDSLYGEAGNDTIYAGDGSDYIDGGADADVLEGQADGDTFRILDTSGNDTIRGGETFTTGSDNDSINAFSVTSGVDVTFDGNETGDLTFGATSVDFSEIEHLTLTDQNDTVNAAADGSGIEVWAYGGDDSILGGSGNDTLYGMNGNDTVVGGGGNDTIIGGAGDDVLRGGSGDDQLFGGDGADTFEGSTEADLMEGGADADTFVIADGFGNDTIVGGDTVTTGINYDTIDLSAVTNPVSVLFDGPGSGTITDSVTGDVITFSGIEQLILTDGNDTVDATLDDGYTYIQTLAGDDSVQGSTGDDIYDDEIFGPNGQGNDTFIGGDGADEIWAGTDNDSVLGGLGADSLYGQSGDDTIDGGADADTLQGGIGNDSVTGGDGADLIEEYVPSGTTVNDGDTVTGTTGADGFVFAGASGTSATIILDDGAGTANDADVAADWVYVTSTGDGAGLTLEGFSYGTDRIQVSEQWAGISSSQIASGHHQVTLTYAGGNTQTFDVFHDNGTSFDTSQVFFTYAGDDTLEGGAGNDTISAAFGADLITGGTGNDSIDVGAGDGVADTVVMSDGDGNDTISGFDAPTPDGDGTFTGLDQIDVSGLTSDGGTTPVTTADVTVTDDGSGNAVLGFPSGDSLTLIGVAPSAVSDPDALVAMGIPDGRDHVVEGTALGDVIDAAYAGDPEGDMVDSNDGNPLAPGPAGGDADSITAGAGADTVEAGAGNDTVLGEAGADSISGGAGDDSIDGGTENDWLSGGADNDTVSGGDGADSVFGDTGDDSLLGGAGNDSMEGWFGNDTIDGGADNDYVDGADGDDMLIGGTGNDTLLGGNDAGADSLDGGAGDDDLSAGDGADTLVGGTGADSMFAGGGDDVFVIEDDFGNDTIDGWSTGETAGDSIDASAVTQDLTLDLSQGNAGSGESGTLSNGTQTAQFIEIESVTLGSGNDSVIGSAGGDTVSTGAGNDTVNAGDGADSIDGGAGNDSIFVDQGDTVSGGDGDDYFTLQDLDTSGTGNAAITITGGEGGETGGDTLQLTPDVSFADITFSNTDDAAGGLSGSFTMADGTLVSFSEIENIICFTPGTMILTGHGERAIETLELGDLVVTRDHGLRPIRWIGKRTVKGNGRFAPVRVGAGAMDGARTGLLVSPQHRILFTGYKAELLFGEPEVLVPAKHLIDGREVIQVEQDEVTYIHIMFDCHEVIYAEGIATESFHAGDMGLSAICEAAREELFAIFPELRSAPGHHRDTARPCLKKHEARLLTRDGDGLEADFF